MHRQRLTNGEEIEAPYAPFRAVVGHICCGAMTILSLISSSKKTKNNCSMNPESNISLNTNLLRIWGVHDVEELSFLSPRRHRSQANPIVSGEVCLLVDKWSKYEDSNVSFRNTCFASVVEEKKSLAKRLLGNFLQNLYALDLTFHLPASRPHGCCMAGDAS